MIKGVRSSDDLQSVYNGIKTLKITGSDNVGNDNSINQDGTLTKCLIEKVNGYVLREKNMNCM